MLSKIATISCPKSLGLFTEDSIGEQAKGKGLEYRIITVNKAGVFTDAKNDYPDNIRELENTIEHCFVLCQDEREGEKRAIWSK